MRKLFFFIPVFLCLHPSQSQMVRAPVGTVYTKLNTYSQRFGDVFSFGANQAALAATKKMGAGVYSERRFLLQDLSIYTMAVALPTPSGNFGFKADYAGGPLYHETSLGLAYARRLDTKVDVGVQFNYYSLNASAYGTASAVNVEAGVLVHLSERLTTGVHLYNPGSVSFGNGEERLPFVYSAGLGYDVSPKFYLGFEAEKTEDKPLAINAGLHYQFAPGLVARGGIYSAASVYYAGFGVLLQSIRVDVTASVHSYLGVTPGLLILYSPKE